MKDYCLELTAAQSGFNAKLNAMREYLQAYVLRALHDEGFFRSAAFVGGTALRFLYGLPRFSEDLAFSLTGEKGAYSFDKFMHKVDQELKLAGYQAAVTFKSENTVQNAMVKFEGLLFEAKLSPLKAQKFSIKIEIDTKPPAGAVLKTELVNKYFPISFLSYDTASLFAGKLHAILSRKYAKGRDYFDLGWYLSRWKGIEPNFEFLNNALKQTGWTGGVVEKNSWRMLVSGVVERLDWKKIKEDVENFLENSKDTAIFTKDNTLALLRNL